MKEFNITQWLNKKPDNNETPIINNPINPINPITPNSLHSSHNSNFSHLSQEKTSTPKSVDCCPLSIDLQKEIEFLTKIIEERSIDIAPDYQSWRDLGFALTDALGENGREYFHRLSRFYPNYSYEETDKQYTACLNAHGHGITSKTIFHLAKQAGITIAHNSPITPIIPTKTPITPNEVFEVLEENENITSNQMPTFSDKVKDYLPDFLKKIAGNAISDEDADLLILGTLPQSQHVCLTSLESMPVVKSFQICFSLSQHRRQQVKGDSRYAVV